MKFSFKIQQYQTDAVDAVARVFQGQPYSAGVSYLRDMGSLSAKPKQLSLMPMADDAAQLELQDLINDSGFKNEALQLTDADLVQNIRALQAESNIHQSDKLVAPLGRCSLDIEMETGTGKTYVYIKTMFELNKRCLLYTSKMAVSYNRLFKLMIDRKMRKKDLCELAGVSTSTMSKMGRDEIVSLEVIDRICQKLNCRIEDVLEILPDSPDNGTSKNVK